MCFWRRFSEIESITTNKRCCTEGQAWWVIEKKKCMWSHRNSIGARKGKMSVCACTQVQTSACCEKKCWCTHSKQKSTNNFINKNELHRLRFDCGDCVINIQFGFQVLFVKSNNVFVLFLQATQHSIYRLCLDAKVSVWESAASNKWKWIPHRRLAHIIITPNVVCIYFWFT